MEEPSRAVTRYQQMRVQNIPSTDNILASVFTWLVLAGFVVIPSAFTSVQNSQILQSGAGIVWDVARHVPVLVIAGVCCVVGASGMLKLGVSHNDNYDWLINHLFLPAIMNSFVGFLAAIFNIYATQHNEWSLTAIITVSIISTCLFVNGNFYLIYSIWLQEIKREHKAQYPKVRN